MSRSNRGTVSLAFAGVVFLLVIILGGFGVYTLGTWGHVEVGYASILRNSWDGTIKAGPVGPLDKPGMKAFMFEDIIPIRIAVDSVYMWSKYDKEDNEIERGTWEAPVGITKDGIRLPIDINVFWTLNYDQDKMAELYQVYPLLNYKEVVFVPAIREIVRDVIKDKTFDQIIEQREQLPTLIAEGVVRKITDNPTLPNGLINIDKGSVQLLEIHMPYKIQLQLQERKNSEISITTAENTRKTGIINADTLRQQEILKALGAAQARMIDANATRDSIRQVVEALTVRGNPEADSQAAQLYITLQTMKEIARDGKNVIFMVGSDSRGNLFLIPIEGSKP